MSLETIFNALDAVKFRDWEFFVGGTRRDQHYLQIEFNGKCALTGAVQKWRSRKWQLSLHMTKSEVVQTAFKAVMTALEHEAREEFTYKGAPIFGPHFDVDQLFALVNKGAAALDTRKEKSV